MAETNTLLSLSASLTRGSRVRREKQPKIIDLGCICHLENLCVVNACKKLVIPVDELLIDVFYNFHNRYNLYATGCILVIKIIKVVD